MLPWTQLETIIRRDPGGRGVAAFREQGHMLGAGDLQEAAIDLAQRARAVAIVTGFCIVDADPPAAETDGPPGALLLANALMIHGCEVTIISDAYGMPLLRAGVTVHPLHGVALCEIPFESGSPDAPPRSSHDHGCNAVSDAWVAEFFERGPGARLTHLIAIERVGPSHTSASVCSRRENAATPQADSLREFEESVPREHRDRCHNMRGRDITGYTAKTHRLFEYVAERRRPIVTIGIADGGNELGMGKFPWETLCRAIATGSAATIACRIAADNTILAGVSNWGGYALGLAFDQLRGGSLAADSTLVERERQAVEAIVAAGAVDGVTRRRKPSVDGLPFDGHVEVLRDLQAAVVGRPP